MSKSSETNPKDWDFYWSKRDRRSISSWIPRLQQYLLRKFIDQDFIKMCKEYSHKGSIVEVGSGLGLNSISIAEERGDTVYLIDFSSKALEQAKTVAKNSKVNVKTFSNDIRDKLPFDDKFFTLAWNVGTIEHFEKPEKIVEEMKRVSKCVICIVPMAHPLRLAYEKIRKIFGLGVDGHYVLYTPDTLEMVFSKAGFKNIKTKEFIYVFGFISFCGAVGTD